MTIESPIRRAIPPDANIDHWIAPDGWRLRRFVWAGSTRGSILFLGGRGDVFEKYLEAFHYWHRAGWTIASFDWRGQGGSGRLSGDAHVGHAEDFAPWIADLAAFWESWKSPGPRVVIGHSMGGHLALRALLEHVITPDAAVLVAPMIGLKTPVGAAVGERIARLMRRLGDPARPAWKGHERPRSGVAARQKLLTADISRYADEQWWYAQVPEIKLGPPSWAWLERAFASTREQRTDPRIADLRLPVLMLVADADGLVDAAAAVGVAERLPDAELIRFGRESAHEILREADPVRDRALAAIDDFLARRAA